LLKHVVKDFGIEYYKAKVKLNKKIWGINRKKVLEQLKSAVLGD
jgi:hypothetical protein